MNTDKRIINSAIWAAYGDSLGFITELADINRVTNRVGQSTVTNLTRWKKRVGGPYGPDILLPSGCYSDDTQLRLATSRTIGISGNFDVEVFAKIELTVWPTYALGGGIGTKAASANLTRSDTNWFSNFFVTKKSSYINCGGNGAAMRIQPHVWVSQNRTHPKHYILDVIRNSICTHGHFRGILGAVFHALCLAASLENNAIPNPRIWEDAVFYFDHIHEIMLQDHNIKFFWIPTWERMSNKTITDAIKEVRDECLHDLRLLNDVTITKQAEAYIKAATLLGIRKTNEIGSGTKTAILASYAAWLFKDNNPADAMLTIVNALGTDTDTIATMAGAILGAATSLPPDSLPADSDYITTEGNRILDISKSLPSYEFSYPDIQHWSPPKTQLDAIGLCGRDCALAGIGYIEPVQEEKAISETKLNAEWQWYNLPFGQVVLSKRRKDLRQLPQGNCPVNGNHVVADAPLSRSKTANDSQPTLQKRNIENTDFLQSRLSNTHDEPSGKDNNHQLLSNENNNNLSSYQDIDALTQQAISSNFEESIIGNHIVCLSKQHNGIDKVIGYSAIIAKAIATRHRRKSN